MRRLDSVSLVLGAGVAVMLALVVAQVARLQLATPGALRPYVDERVSTRTLEPVRADLRDRRGRPLSMTRLVRRIVVDPTLLPDPPDEVIVQLAEVLDLPADEIGERLLRALSTNDQRRAPEQDRPRFTAIEHLRSALNRRGAAKPVASDGTPKPIRYVPIGEPVEPDLARRVRALGLPGVWVEPWAKREYPGGEIAASLVGKVGFEHQGLLGAELAFDQDLRGERAKVRYVRDARGRALWMDAGQWRLAERSEPVRVSVDLEIQRIAHEEAQRGMVQVDGAGVRAVVLDPHSGEILAMVDLMRDIPGAVPFPWEPKDVPPHERAAWPPEEPARYRALEPDVGRLVHPSMGRNRCVEDIYEPGSTFKPFIWSAVTALGRAEPQEAIDTEGGRWRTSYGRYLEDVTKRDEMTWGEVLVYSSNIGMVKAGERISGPEMRDMVRAFGFGRRTDVGLAGETGGLVTSEKNWSKYTHTSVSFGYEVGVTPVQMVRAFSAFARSDGMAGTTPTLRLTAAGDERAGGVVERVVPAWVARTARHYMVSVAERMESALERRQKRDGEPIETWDYRIFGKSGTAQLALGAPPEGMRLPRGSRGYLEKQYRTSFVAGGPVEQPRLVVLVVVDDPGPEWIGRREHYGSHTAGPIVRRILERSLAYLGVPPSPVAQVPEQAENKNVSAAF